MIASRLEIVSAEPDGKTVLRPNGKLAEQQYEALLAYAKRPDGLPAKLTRDRRAELTALEHKRSAQIFFRLANVLTFGKYAHREEERPDIAPLDVARQRAYHTLFLREVARSGSPQIDVV